MALDPSSFRAVLGRFASGVTVVTLRDEQGSDRGMTVSAFCSLSLEPPLVLMCVEHESSVHALLQPGTRCAINILAADQEALSRRFAGPEEGRFDGVGFTRGQHGIPVLDDALAQLECRVTKRHPGGDHSIVICDVEAAAISAERPLLYYRGGYTQLAH